MGRSRELVRTFVTQVDVESGALTVHCVMPVGSMMPYLGVLLTPQGAEDSMSLFIGPINDIGSLSDKA